MTLKRSVFRALNRALAVGGLRLDRLERDFDDAPIDSYTLDRTFAALASAFDLWLAGQTIFAAHAAFDTHAAVGTFFAAWREQPFRDRQGGSRFNNLLWLHLIARAWAPEVIVDSGTWRGASAWALATACPGAATHSFDIDLSQLTARTDGVRYVQADWTEAPPDVPRGARLLCYFDDHVDQVRRLIEAADRGCALALFDDDYPVTSYYAMAPGPSVLPKLEFVLDMSLVDGQSLEWRSGGRHHRWTVDRAYLDAARARIAATERLPNTSLVTGIHQTPYRIVALRPAAA